jgi:diguanylate cyclase (GGDEF)-like protein
MVDIDHFKQINDSHGHLVGDAVLREAARRLRSSIRPYDSIGRYGGEEFLIIVPGADPQGAFKQAERLRASMSREPITSSGGQVNVTISLGVTVNSGGEKGEELIHAADAALYQAKSRGRNRTEHSWKLTTWCGGIHCA